MTHPSLEGFTWWVEERERIREAKERGDPHPLTDDPILQRYRFANVYRTEDTVSRWMAKCLWEDERPELLANCVIHRSISYIPTSQKLGWITNPSKVIELLDECRRTRTRWATFSFKTQLRRQVWRDMVEYLFNTDELHRMMQEIEYTNTLKDTTEILHDIPGIGDFFAWQITADLTNTYLLRNATDRNDYALAGPGAKEGLRVLGLPLTLDGMKTVRDYHNANSDKKLTIIDTQHSLCEYRRYEMTFNKRTHPKRRYYGAN